MVSGSGLGFRGPENLSWLRAHGLRSGKSNGNYVVGVSGLGF